MKLKIFTALLCVLMIFSITTTAYCETDKRGSITVNFERDDVEFEIHKIGYLSDGAIELYDAYECYSVNMDSKNAAYTLTAYIKRDKLEPYGTAVTDAKGRARFTDLERGIYLVIGENFDREGLVYRFESSIVSLPYVENDTEHWDLDVEIKYEKEVYEYGEIEIKVLKVWLRNHLGNNTPNVTIQLLRNWEVYDTIVLNDENDWKHKWDNLDNRYFWCVVESSLARGFFVDIELDGDMHTVSNTGEMDYPTEPTTPTEPTQPDTTAPTTTSSTAPTASTEPTQPKTTVKDDSSTDYLPQTGQLNWPIPVLACVGALLIILGIALMRKPNEKQ